MIVCDICDSEVDKLNNVTIIENKWAINHHEDSKIHLCVRCGNMLKKSIENMKTEFQENEDERGNQ